MELYFIHPDISWLIRRLFQLHISHYDSIILIVSFNLFPTMISQKAKQIISILIINGMKLPLPIRVLSGVPKKVIIGVAYLWPAGKGGCMEQTNVSNRPQGIQDVPNQIEQQPCSLDMNCSPILASKDAWPLWHPRNRSIWMCAGWRKILIS